MEVFFTYSNWVAINSVKLVERMYMLKMTSFYVTGT